ncbi:hypothetical protein VCHA37P192_80139 [Vibrio chagasii]|nr:hypothetical protein VCHA37P192_80139 [Vibrio chagasii]
MRLCTLINKYNQTHINIKFSKIIKAKPELNPPHLSHNKPVFFIY